MKSLRAFEKSDIIRLHGRYDTKQAVRCMGVLHLVINIPGSWIDLSVMLSGSRHIRKKKQ